MHPRRERARPLTPEERRAALIDATVPLLYQHGRNVTTRLIAEAAGVAEGTIFRVFSTKDELVDAALAQALQPGILGVRIREIDPALPLEQRLLTMTSVLQQRFQATFGLLRAMGIMGPPPGPHEDRHRALEELERAMVAVVEPDADRLSVEPAMLVHTLRMLTFVGTNPHFADNRLLSPQQIVDLLLHGVLKREP